MGRIKDLWNKLISRNTKLIGASNEKVGVSLEEWEKLKDDPEEQRRLLDLYYKKLVFDEDIIEATPDWRGAFKINDFINSTNPELQYEVISKFINGVIDPNNKGLRKRETVNLYCHAISTNTENMSDNEKSKVLDLLISKLEGCKSNEKSSALCILDSFYKLLTRFNVEQNPENIQRVSDIFLSSYYFTTNYYEIGFGDMFEDGSPLVSQNLINMMEKLYNSPYNLIHRKEDQLSPIRKPNGELDIGIYTFCEYIHTLKLEGKFDMTLLEDELAEALANSLQRKIDNNTLDSYGAYLYCSLVNKNDKCRKVILDNADLILGKIKLDPDATREFIKNLDLEDDELLDVVIKDMQEDIDRERLYMEDAYWYITTLGSNEKTKQVIIDNAEYFMSITASPMEVRRIMGEEFAELPEVRRGVNSNIRSLVCEMMIQNADGTLHGVGQPDIDVLMEVLKEIVEQEGIELADIHRLGNGSYSTAYSVGNKIIKTSFNELQSFAIQRNAERFIQPIFRHRFQYNNKDGENVKGVMEVEEKVDMDTQITEDELYEVYKNIREHGMIWTDIKTNNVGRLMRDNTIYVDGIRNPEEGEKHVYAPNLGFIEDSEIGILKKGEVVLIDLDWVFPLAPDAKRDYSIPVPFNREPEVLEFERRFQKERKPISNTIEQER